MRKWTVRISSADAIPAVFADANVLAGALRRHVFLALADAGLIYPRWSRAVLMEAGHAHAKIVEAKPGRDGAGEAALLLTELEAAFPEADVPESLWAHVRIEGKLPDRGDEHVIQAAAAGGARFIQTENLKDFPAAVLGTLGLSAVGSDALYAERLANRPEEGAAALRAMAERLKLDDARFADALKRSRLKRTAARLGLSA
ncbi:MAG: PIN domain-containing protein [Oceanicaulis sp.]